MGVVFEEEKQVFLLNTRNTSYQFRIAEFGFLEHLYYGKRINEPVDYLPIRLRHGFEANPYEMKQDRSLCLDLLEQEYPGFGVSDFKTSACSIIHADGSNCIDFRYVSHRIYDGKYEIEGMPSLRKKEGDWITLEVVMKDIATKVEAILLYGVLESQDIITRHVIIRNLEVTNITLNSAYSTCLTFPTDQMDQIDFYGSWGHERNVQRTSVRHGKSVVDSIRGISSHYYNPAIILCERTATETAGDCYGTALVYSGNFAITVEVNDFKQTRMIAGIHPDTFMWELKPGECFATPEAVMSFSSEGLTGLSHNFHNVVRHFLIPEKFEDERCPVLLNNWEATMIDFDEEQLVKIAQTGKELGVEMFVMDDGWFGRRTNEFRGLGDWQCNLEKLPSGIAGFSKRIHNLGLKFGIWIEPEMVSEDSKLYEEHPEWCIRIPGRNPTRQRYQLILDYSRNEVVEAMFQQLYEEFKDAKIDYIKWDMNRSMTDRYSTALDSSRQGELCHRYVLGFYKLMEKLTEAFPDVRIEGCCGGGGRFDLGVLYYAPQIWCSDDTDAIERIEIQHGTSFFYPPSVMGSHVSVCPNQQTGRSVPIDTRASVAYYGTFGYELDPNELSLEEKEAVKKQIEYYKKYAHVSAFGNYYRLTDMGKEFVAFMSVAKDRSSAIFTFVQLKTSANKGIIYIKLQGLDENKIYVISELGLELSGSSLMYAGLPMPVIKADYMAKTYTLEER